MELYFTPFHTKALPHSYWPFSLYVTTKEVFYLLHLKGVKPINTMACWAKRHFTRHLQSLCGTPQNSTLIHGSHCSSSLLVSSISDRWLQLSHPLCQKRHNFSTVFDLTCKQSGEFLSWCFYVDYCMIYGFIPLFQFVSQYNCTFSHSPLGIMEHINYNFANCQVCLTL